MTEKEAIKVISLALALGFLAGMVSIIILANTMGWFNGN